MPGWPLSRRSVFVNVALVGSAALAGVICGGCNGGMSTPPPPPPPPPPPATFELVQVANGFSAPLDIQQPNDASGRLFVVEQGGHVQIIQSNGTRAATPFLDITGRAGFTSGGETGLLGLAFQRDAAANCHCRIHRLRHQRKLRRPNHRKYSFHR